MSNYDGNERILLVVGLGNPGAEYEGTVTTPDSW